MEGLFADMEVKPAAVSPTVRKSAVLSECGRYRYRLGRSWDDALPPVNFVMLNPSTADADVDDPTIRRCIRYARDWGYGSLVVTNLFAFRATDPRGLRKADDPVGPENDRHTIEAATTARDAGGLVVCAWGVMLGPRRRRIEVVGLMRRLGVDLHAIKLSGGGHPCHPLYLKADLRPVRWPAAEP